MVKFGEYNKNYMNQQNPNDSIILGPKDCFLRWTCGRKDSQRHCRRYAFSDFDALYIFGIEFSPSMYLTFEA